MKFLALPYIKEHSRIDFDCDDAVLQLYGNAAEDVTLNIIRRTYENLQDRYGTIPPAIRQAALMLTEVGYAHRSPVSMNNKSVIPYTYDTLIAEYMRLDKATPIQAERNDLLSILGSTESDLDFNYSELDEPTAEQTAGYNDLKEKIRKTNIRFRLLQNPTASICQVLRNKIKSIRTQAEALFNENEND